LTLEGAGETGRGVRLLAEVSCGKAEDDRG